MRSLSQILLKYWATCEVVGASFHATQVAVKRFGRVHEVDIPIVEREVAVMTAE